MQQLSRIQKLFIMLILLNSGTPLNLDYQLPVIIMIGIFFAMICTGEVRVRFEGKTALYCILVCIVWIFQYLFARKGTLSISAILKVWIIMTCMFMYTASNSEQNGMRFRYFMKMIFTFSVISNFLFLLLLLRFPLPIIYVDYKTIPSVFYLENYALSGNYGVLGFRNSGIFWEPGMYQIYLNLYLLYTLYRSDISPKKRMMLTLYCIAAVFTTGSVTGVALCTVIISLYGALGIKKFGIKIFAVICILAALTVVFPYLMNMINTKMTVGHSYSTRVSDISVGLELFLKKPIWGYGVYSTEYAEYYGSIYGTNRGNTNGLIMMLIQSGTVGAIVVLLQLYGLLRFLRTQFSARMSISFIIWFFVSLCNEPIANHVSVFFILGLGMKNIAYSISRFEKEGGCS